MTAARNLLASVRQRLLDLARREGRPFNELLQSYAMERFFCRLSQRRHGSRMKDFYDVWLLSRSE